MPSTTVELWYIQTTANNHNSRVYIDMLNDIRKIKSGLFTCNMKINNGVICDYVVIEDEAYVEPTGTEVDRVVR